MIRVMVEDLIDGVEASSSKLLAALTVLDVFGKTASMGVGLSKLA